MSSDRQPPAERASAIINSVPSTSLATKTGTVILGTGLTAAAISQELYVVNEETVILAGTAILFAYIAKVRVYFTSCLPRVFTTCARPCVSRTKTGQREISTESVASLMALAQNIRRLSRHASTPSGR